MLTGLAERLVVVVDVLGVELPATVTVIVAVAPVKAALPP
jgi:hypothetical protein